MTHTFSSWWRHRWTAERCARRATDRCRNDEGFTLTELLIASTLLVVLLTVVMISMSAFGTISNNISSQYDEYDQALPALAPIQSLLRAEIEPAPYAFPQTPYAYGQPGHPAAVPAGPPTPAFASIGNYSLTFYSNIGTAYNIITSAGTTAGPAKSSPRELDSSGNPPTASECTVSSPCSFQVREYLPSAQHGGQRGHADMPRRWPTGWRSGTACASTGPATISYDSAPRRSRQQPFEQRRFHLHV